MATLSEAANASVGLMKHNVTMYDVCPLGVGKLLEQIRYLDESMRCSKWSSDKTDDSNLFSES